MNATKQQQEEGLIFLPDSFLRQRGINPASVVPSWLAPASVILQGAGDVGDLSQVAGRAGKPGDFTLIGTKEGQPIMIIHDKETEAAEIEDLAMEAIETRKPIDFAAARERQGLPPAAEFDALLREAASDFIKRSKANSVTMKPRDPNQQFVKGLVTVPALSWQP